MELHNTYGKDDKLAAEAARRSIRNGVFDWLSDGERQLIPSEVPAEIAALYPGWRRFSVWAE